MKAHETAPGDGPPGESLHGSFGEFLEELRSLFPSALIGTSGWERLVTLAHRLPIHVTDNRFGFEFDLCDPAPAADFCVVPAPGSRLAAFYARHGELAPRESAEAALGAFLAEQASNPQALLAEEDAGVILEYDLAGLSPDQPAPPPGIFLVPRPRDESRTWKLFSDPERFAAALWSVAGWTPDAAIQGQLRRVYEAMPPIGSVTQAGVLPGRAQRAVRLIIRTDSGKDAVELLSRLGWSGPPADVLAVSESLKEMTKPGVSLSVDVAARGIPPGSAWSSTGPWSGTNWTARGGQG